MVLSSGYTVTIHSTWGDRTFPVVEHVNLGKLCLLDENNNQSLMIDYQAR